MINKEIKAIAFDFWGVFAVINPPMNKYLKERGVDLSGEQQEAIHDLIIEHDLGKINEEQFLKLVSKLVGMEIPYAQCRYLYEEGELDQELIATVEKLKTKYKIALLSNNNREYVQEHLYKPGLNKLFDVMVFSYDVGVRKPAPEMYQALIDKLGLPSQEILYIDDESDKLPQAEGLGMQTQLYERKNTVQTLRSFI